MRPKLVYIGFCYPHHRNTQAGYNNIKEYLKYDYIIDCNNEMDFIGTPPKSLTKRIARKLYRMTFGVGAPLNILKCVFYSMFHRNVVFHFIYPEMTFKWFHHFKFGNKIVFTIHQPFEKLIKSSLDKYVCQADALILMSVEDKERIVQRYGIEKVEFIPHGINCSFYKPASDVQKKEQICMVGSWLRNFDLASDVFNMLHKHHPSLIFKVVTARDNFEKLPSYVQKYTGITDDELLNIYRESQCVYLPLYQFTANNAVLEAAATGCQLVIASDDINRSYFSDAEVYYCNSCRDKSISSIEQVVYAGLTKDSNLLRTNIVDLYSWEVIAERTKNFLTSEL